MKLTKHTINGKTHVRNTYRLTAPEWLQDTLARLVIVAAVTTFLTIIALISY